MKKILYIVLTAVLFAGCNKELAVSTNNNDFVNVKLTLFGEVSVAEEILTTKSFNPNQDLIGIQVYQDDQPYAYGLFDDESKLSINLHTGKNYSLKSQLIKNGKNALLKLSASSGDPCYYASGSLYSGKSGDRWSSYGVYGNVCHFGSTVYYFSPYSSGYGEPFCFNQIYGPDAGVATGYSYYKTITVASTTYYQFLSGKLPYYVTQVIDITNKFVYESAKTMNIESSYARSNDPLRVDRYYGECSIPNASDGQNIAILDMKHLVYGIQCNVTGVSDGTATITIKNGDSTLLEKTDISSEYHSDDLMFAFSDMHSAWQYSDNYTENVTVSMTWLRGVGVTQDLGSQVVQVKRNCMNVITVSLSATKAGAALGVESESADMSNESVDCSTHF